MTLKTPGVATVSTSYTANPAKPQIKLVVTKKTEAVVKTISKITFHKTHFALDSNGGGYMGL